MEIGLTTIKRSGLSEDGYRSRLPLYLGVLRRYWRATGGIVVAMMISSFLEAAGILSLLPLLQIGFGEPGSAAQETEWLSRLLESIGLPTTFGTILLVIGVTLVAAKVGIFLCTNYIGFVASRFNSDLRLALVSALARARPDYQISRPIGGYTALLSSEANRAASAYIASCNLLTHSLYALVLLGAALSVNLAITGAALAVGALLLVLLRSLMSLARSSGKAVTVNTDKLLARTTDGFAAIKAIHAMGQTGRLTDMLRKSILALDVAQRHQVFSKTATVAVQEVTIVVALVGGVFVAHVVAELSLSVLIVLAALFHRSVSSLAQLQKDYQGILNSEAGLNAILEAISQAEAARETHTGRLQPHFEREIAVRSVSFSYGESRILDSVSLDIPVGGFVVVVGPSGAGKTTLIDLVAGLVQPRRGEILVDGVSMSEIDQMAWRRSIGYVPQDPILFHDTIRYNVSLGDPAVSPDDVRCALELADAASYIDTLEHGIDTVVGERGARLSGGQRQRVAIARALVRRPKLLILDEPTASLDPNSEQELCQSLARLAGETTVLAITHRPALLQAATRIFRLVEGRIEPAVSDADIPSLRKSE